MKAKSYITDFGLQIYRYIMPGIESNMFLILKEETALVIDPNVNQEALSFLKAEGVENITVLITHEHCDHISGVNWLRENFPVEVIASKAAGRAMQNPAENLARFWELLLMDMPPERKEAGMKAGDTDYSCHADRTFEHNMQLNWGGYSITMQTAPGHSKGGALVQLEDVLFSGDNLVNGSGVICRLPGGSWKTYCREVRPLLERLPDEMLVFPGHGEPARLAELRKYMDKFGNV